MLSTHGRHAGGIAAALALALLVLIASAASRGTEYDEDYTVFIASGTPRPVWPSGPFTAGSVRHFFAGHSTALSIARDLRRTDVHPPLYFWAVAAWRGLFGSGLFETRLLSVLFSLVALLGVARLAVLVGAPPVAAVLLTIGCYGFTYTGSIARGFALAQLCLIWGTALVAQSARPRGRARGAGIALAGGLLLGLGSFSNYLAAFGAAGALLWLLLARLRRPERWIAAGIGFVLLLPADLYFFLAQRGSRIGQFPPFRLLPSLVRLAKYTSANIFGGLPLYVGHLAGLLVGLVLVLGLIGLFALVVLRWRAMSGGEMRWLPAMAAAATPIGLLLLGMVFNNTPIELRYIAFGVPFFAVLLAAGFASLPRRTATLAIGALFAVQALSLIGMMTQPQTMQPQAQTARAARRLAGPGTLVLVPYGNDGVGVLAAFVNESPDRLLLAKIDPGESPAAIRAEAHAAQRVVLVLLGLDADSRATLPAMRQAFHDRCWQPAGSGFDTMAYDRARAPGCGNQPAG